MNTTAVSPLTGHDRPRAQVRRWKIDGDVLGLLALILLLVVTLYVLEPRFVNRLNLLNVARNSSFLLIVACGQMMVMIVGGYDLSVGPVIALASVVSSMLMSWLFGMAPDQTLPCILAGVAAGLVSALITGLVNGVGVALLGMPPFMVTLGTLSITSGAAFYLTHGMPLYGMPVEFTETFGRAAWLGLPVVAFIALGLVAALCFLQRRTVLGRHLYAIGGNPQAARQSGIAVPRGLMWTYILCAGLAGVTGILLTARIGSGQANLGSELMLQSVGAAVLAGASLRGGVGRIERVILSSVFLTLVANGMNLVRVESKVQTIVLGALLIVFVAVPALRSKGVHHG